ncbi:hypothetical protein SCHPADRAFT_710406 [Schizopora paradoxa]|uniref:Uncharacterized protein n=1 Tax=Schizopora paradoxa TaxID=27342 RepID=A0A0H2RLU9_9AGAM|nr:hypothetical protein SCHPADRAFT_710406 [Schizopora paradoxa]
MNDRCAHRANIHWDGTGDWSARSLSSFVFHSLPPTFEEHDVIACLPSRLLRVPVAFSPSCITATHISSSPILRATLPARHLPPVPPVPRVYHHLHLTSLNRRPRPNLIYDHNHAHTQHADSAHHNTNRRSLQPQPTSHPFPRRTRTRGRES